MLTAESKGASELKCEDVPVSPHGRVCERVSACRGQEQSLGPPELLAGQVAII